MNVPEQYQVVALRYRPQQFDALVGQSHITTALANAITQNRVGHAYLFTGARGVGKTSSARIFAKCLNCVKGPTTDPCNECDICQAVSVGDEVHMLTSQAFNALLKTLEEPPAHVKFIFCTTDPQKIPITVLSRCQRFDFSPVKTDKIADRLREIAKTENVAAEDDALQLLARRANGSMRDSQSLLEQLLSFCGEKITVDEVHQLLGTTDVTRIAEIASAMTEKDSARTLELIHDNLSSGANAGQLADQLLAYFRDMMVTRVGCGEDTLICCSSNETEALAQQGQQLGLDTVLMVVQILDNAVVAMQSSLHARVLLEVAAVKICGLEHLESIGALIKSLSSVGNVTVGAGQGSAEPAAKKTTAKKNEVNNDQPQITEAVPPLDNGAAATDSASIAVVSNAAAPTAIATATASAVVAAAVVSNAHENTEPEAELEEPNPTTAQSSEPAIESQSADANSNVSAGTQPSLDESLVASVAVADTLDATEITAENATGIYQNAITAMGDMTANMAQRFEKVELDRGKMVVTMLDAYNTTLCSKPERKAKIESAIKELTGKSIRIDFVTTTTPAVETVAAKPKLTRIQQIRELQQQPFVKEAIELFDCEISDYYQRQNAK